ncbi:MAG TPA: hypothetical protein VFB58_00750 [Chloroflexota bacterium]|nr:hypothetical protein [Chloroflexota bacterium]
MRKRALPALAWSLGVLSAVLTGLTVYLIALNHLANPADALYPLDFVAFALVGAFIAAYRPHNAIGWLFCLIGLSNIVSDVAQQYAVYAVITHPHTVPAGVFMFWAGTGWMATIGWATMALFIPLLFPTGRLLSPRWRIVAILGAIVIAVEVAFQAFMPFSGGVSYFPRMANPYAVTILASLKEMVTYIGMLLVVGVMVAAVVSLVLRFQRAGRDEQLQIKWFAYAAALLAVSIALAIVNSAVVHNALVDNLSTPLQLIAVSALPISAAVAILRHRLYDIDVVINRTLVYGSLTLSLAAVYIGGVIALEALFRFVSGQNSDLAVAVATLAVAALFNPWRQRLQAFIDRRFYRRRYDAARALAAFTVQLRDEVDLEKLTGDMLDVLQETIQPASASIWLADRRVL